MKQLRAHITSFRYAYIGGLLAFFLWQLVGAYAPGQQPLIQEEAQQQTVKCGVAGDDSSQTAGDEDTSQKSCWEQAIVHKAVLSVLRFDFKHPFLFLFDISLPSPESTRIVFFDFSPRLIYYEYLFRYFVVVNAP